MLLILFRIHYLNLLCSGFGFVSHDTLNQNRRHFAGLCTNLCYVILCYSLHGKYPCLVSNTLLNLDFENADLGGAYLGGADLRGTGSGHTELEGLDTPSSKVPTSEALGLDTPSSEAPMWRMAWMRRRKCPIMGPAQVCA